MAVRQQTITQKAVSFISKNANIHTNTQQPTRLEQWLGVKIKRRMDSVETSESTTKKLKTNDEPIDLMCKVSICSKKMYRYAAFIYVYFHISKLVRPNSS